MGGETVPQRVRSDPLVDVRGLGGLDDDAVELARADMGRCALSGKEPAVGTQNALLPPGAPPRSEEHTSELQSLMRISYAVFCLKQKKLIKHTNTQHGSQHSPKQHIYEFLHRTIPTATHHTI